MKNLTKKLTVILLGVWHFNPNSTNDAKKINTDILSSKNQKELQEIRNVLAKYNPNKIFIEFNNGKEPQGFLDSLYTDFLDNGEFDIEHPPYTNKELEQFKRTEHFQLSFKLAKQLGLKRLYASDHYASVSTKPIKEWKTNGGGVINKDFFDTQIPVDYPAFDSLLAEKPIKDILLYLNSKSAKKLLQDEYFSFVGGVPTQPGPSGQVGDGPLRVWGGPRDGRSGRRPGTEHLAGARRSAPGALGPDARRRHGGAGDRGAG